MHPLTIVRSPSFVRCLGLIATLALTACSEDPQRRSHTVDVPDENAGGSGPIEEPIPLPDVEVGTGGVPHIVVPCGNGTIDDGEACDDGNPNDGDGCSASCVVEEGWACPIVGATCEKCGNGIKESTEGCDDGNLVSGDGCDSACDAEDGWTCPLPGQACNSCGNGAIDGVEVCDDGNTAAGDGCADDCRGIEAGFDCFMPGEACEQCGDGVVQAHEACDDGNRYSNDGCSFNCTTVEAAYECPGDGGACQSCGNGRIEGTEACDDGNAESDDGCVSDCSAIESGFLCDVAGRACYECGNGIREGSLGGMHEECDDGNATNGDGCSNDCIVGAGWTCSVPGVPCSRCGDGIYQGIEQCDDGGTQSGDGCNANCQLEPGWSCEQGAGCVSNGCGDGFVAGAEECDDGDRFGGDGCNTLCKVEDGYVCPTTGGQCVVTTCGDGLVGGAEQCDDGDKTSGDGCSSTCTIETTCGDGIVGGAEQCDDGDQTTGDGCSSTCKWEAGKACTGTAPDYTCVTTTCGDGKLGNLEGCDDGNKTNGDGCSSTCAVESFYECDGDVGSKSACSKAFQWVAVREFNVSFIAPEGLVYDPATRSFVGYKASGGAQPPLELCLDGTMILHPGSSKSGICPPGSELGSSACKPISSSSPLAREWPFSTSVAGATYDPFAGNWLFLDGSKLYRVDGVDGANKVLASASLSGDGMAVGEDGRLYVTRVSDAKIYVYARNTSAIGFSLGSAVASFSVPTSGGHKLTDDFSLPGFGMIGTFTGNGGNATFRFYDQNASGTAAPVASSTMPGVLIPNTMVDGSPLEAWGGARYMGSGEAATDGSGFVLCADNPSDPCYLFALSCDDDSDCESRFAGTTCQLTDEQGRPLDHGYCGAPAKARDDYARADADSGAQVIAVLDNDTRGESTCADNTVEVKSTTPTLYGGTVTIVKNNPAVCGAASSCVTYEPPAKCNIIDTFDYTALLGGGDIDDATVHVTVECACGNGVLDAGETCDPGAAHSQSCSSTCQLITFCGDGNVQVPEVCDDGNRVSGDGCSWDCRAESCGDGAVTGTEACDDGNNVSGDGCSADCALETVCGDGNREASEQCDDGQMPPVDGDGCSSVCRWEYCGNGTVDKSAAGTFVEGCDDGNNVSGDGCSSTCDIEALCGNTKKEGNEECDDGNLASGDGCSSDCRSEYWCGDGKVTAGEECDGETNCTANCKLIVVR